VIRGGAASVFDATLSEPRDGRAAAPLARQEASMRGSLAFGLIVILLQGGCTEVVVPDDEDPPPPPPPGRAELRVVHASPDAPAVDVYAEGVAEPLLGGLAYGEASEYLALDAADYRVQIRAAGSAATEAPVYEAPLALADGARVTVIAAGLLGGGDDDGFRLLAFAESFEAPAAGATRVRIVHAAPDAPAVDLDLGDDGSAELTGLERFADSGAHGLDLPAGAPLQVAVLAGGARLTAFTTPALSPGGERFLIAVGRVGRLARQADGFALLTVDAHGATSLIRQNPLVYALHAGPDAPNVDLYVGEAEIVDDLPFGGLSHPVQVPPGAYTIDFKAAGQSAVAASAETPALAAGERYLAIATGFLAPGSGEQPFGLLALPERFDFDAGGARLRAVHGSPDAPTVDLGTVDGGLMTQVLVPAVSFGQSSDEGGLAVPAATVRLGVAAAGQGQPAAIFTVAPRAGQRAFVIAAGALSPESHEQSFRLLVVDTEQSPWTASAVMPH
jgi:hypothetical protein